MPAASLLKISPASRIALGLASLAITVVLLISLLFGIMPDRQEVERRMRTSTSEHIAGEAALLLQFGNTNRVDRLLQDKLKHNPELRSIRLRQVTGQTVAEAGPHQLLWHPPEQGGSRLENISVPITADGYEWGVIELVFHASSPISIEDWLKYPPFISALLISLVCFGAFYLYLRRALEYLDPMAVIPDRVRMAYDNFLEAILILDTHGRIILANEAFRHLHPAADTDINGKSIEQMDWLIAGIPRINSNLPWLESMRTKSSIKEKPMEIQQPGTLETTKIVLNCTPVMDGYGNTRGCMVVLSDVTALHSANQKLLKTLDELAQSKEIIEEKNKELEKLATRDPMTGCLNRRALFDAIDPLLLSTRESDGELCCVMGDIDHFKHFNDAYGHSLGDQVIKSVSRCLDFDLRDGDILCRYGGEEFCIFLPATTLEQAWNITDRLRSNIEHEAGKSIRDQDGLRITVSFGIASIRFGAKDALALIDMADKALYQAKAAGRNRVCIWNNIMDEPH